MILFHAIFIRATASFRLRDTRGDMANTQRKDERTFWLWSAPALILLILFALWPIAYTVYLSLFDWKLPSKERTFNGLSNFRYLLGDADFWRVTLNTLMYAASVVIAAQVLAFVLASFLNRPLRGRFILRTAAFTPHVTTPVAAALVWVLLLDPNLGPLRYMESALGWEMPDLLADTRLALMGLIVVGVWREVAFSAVFYLAGLQSLPPECYEAARLEGATHRQALRYITLPLMTPTIQFLVVSSFLAAVKVFDSVALMTQGGPVYPASSTFVYHLYHVGFERFEMGRAAAFATLFFVFLTVIIAVQFRLATRWLWQEEGRS